MDNLSTRELVRGPGPVTSVYLPSAAAGAVPADESAYDQFLFEIARPGGLAVDGLPLCTRSLRAGNVDMLVISVERLGDATVWVAGGRWDLVDADASLRGLGMPINAWRADEALPMAALTIGASVVVTAHPLPLADGVGVLLRRP